MACAGTPTGRGMQAADQQGIMNVPGRSVRNQNTTANPTGFVVATHNGGRGVAFMAPQADGQQWFFTNGCTAKPLPNVGTGEVFYPLKLHGAEGTSTPIGAAANLVVSNPFLFFHSGEQYTFYVSNGTLWVNNGTTSHPVELNWKARGAEAKAAAGMRRVLSAHSFTFVEPTAMNGQTKFDPEDAIGIFVFAATTTSDNKDAPGDPRSDPYKVRLHQIRKCFGGQ